MRNKLDPDFKYDVIKVWETLHCNKNAERHR